MIEKASMPSLVTIQHAIQTAEKEIKRFVDAESDPMLCAILRGRIELSISSLADSIEKKSLDGSVAKRSDGSIDPLHSTVTTGFLEWVGLTLERTKTSYLSQHDPENSSAIHAGCIFFRFSIREEWNLWAIKQQLLVDEAIPLMNGLDPKSWKEYRKEIKHLPDEMVFSIERSLQLANNEGFNNKTPTEWLAWGREHDLDKPILKSDIWLKEPDVCMFYLFESAVIEISKSAIRADEIYAANKAEAKKTETEIPAWKTKAIQKADKIYLAQKEIGIDPSKRWFAYKIAEELEKENIVSVKGKRLNADYILRHGLKGWKRPEI